MNWKLKENIRLNKVCDTCYHGTSFTGKEEITLCIMDLDCADGYFPKLIPRIKTCLEWKHTGVECQTYF